MTRKTFIKTLWRTLVAVCFGGGAAVAHAFTGGRHRIVIERVPLNLALEKPLKIIVLGDIHFDPRFEVKYLKKVVARAVALKPDLVLHTGDFMSYDASKVGKLAEILAPLGGYAVLGNHDFWSGADVITEALETKGNIRVLRNASLQIPGFSDVYVSGLESYWSGKPDSACLDRTPSDSKHLLIVHEPDPFEDLNDSRILLQVSGHTHGGQCRIPLLNYPPILPSWGKNYAFGLFRKDKRALYVTRGIGTVDFPIRFWCPPEITLLEVT